jgi:hypothetical protein
MAGLSALKSAQRYGPTSVRQIACDGRRFASDDPAVWRRKEYEGPPLSHTSYTMHLRPEVQLLCSHGEFFRPLPFSWVQLFTFGEPNDCQMPERDSHTS